MPALRSRRVAAAPMACSLPASGPAGAQTHGACPWPRDCASRVKVQPGPALSTHPPPPVIAVGGAHTRSQSSVLSLRRGEPASKANMPTRHAYCSLLVMAPAALLAGGSLAPKKHLC